jgi:hypothetical protein
MIRILFLPLALFVGCSAVPAAAQARVACAPAPAIVLLPDFADPDHVFAAGSAPFRATAANFAVAYARACRSGLLRGRRAIGAGAADRSRLFLLNAPDANVASIYVRGADDRPPAARRPVLEYYFVTSDGSVHVPSVDDLHEAIYCHVRGATPREEEETGRCLPD